MSADITFGTHSHMQLQLPCGFDEIFDAVEPGLHHALQISPGEMLDFAIQMLPRYHSYGSQERMDLYYEDTMMLLADSVGIEALQEHGDSIYHSVRDVCHMLSQWIPASFMADLPPDTYSMTLTGYGEHHVKIGVNSD